MEGLELMRGRAGAGTDFHYAAVGGGDAVVAEGVALDELLVEATRRPCDAAVGGGGGSGVDGLTNRDDGGEGEVALHAGCDVGHLHEHG